MNVEPVLRAMLGNPATGEGSKALELRIGQIVRGVLLEMLDQHEALVNINGVQVRARLDAELPVGRSALLQVQPGSKGGSIVLKPLSDTSDLLPQEGLKDVLKSFGLPDRNWSHELLRGLKRDGYPIGKETAAYFRSAAAMIPAGADAQSWMASADVAFRRGLPATRETISSLRQALFGQPLHAELEAFAESLKAWIGRSGGSAVPSPPSPQTPAMAERLLALLADGERLLEQGGQQLSGTPDKPADRSPGTAFSFAAAKQQTDGEQTSTARTADFGETRPAASGIGSSAANSAGNLAPGESEIKKPFDADRAPEAKPPFAASSARSVPEPAESGQARRDAAANAGVAPREFGVPAHAVPPQGEPPDWIGKFLKWLGVSHEHNLLQFGGDFPSASSLMGEREPNAAEAPRSTSESLKSALLAFANHEEAPQALREAAQTLASQITGQQLLLSTDRQTNAPFSLMTLFVPMKGQDGETTAAVHVQTRRGRRGEWDTDNCRLLFDLRMRHLGVTIVDVQVVDRIVAIKLMNDFPGMDQLAEQARDELNAGLRASGYQLLSITVQPLPEWKHGSGSDGAEMAGKPENPLASAYAAKPYKGVDFRA